MSSASGSVRNIWACDSLNKPMFSFSRILPNKFSKMIVPVYTFINSVWEFISIILVELRYLIVVSYCISLMSNINTIPCSFGFLHNIFHIISHCVKRLSESFAYFSIGLWVFFILRINRFWYSLELHHNTYVKLPIKARLCYFDNIIFPVIQIFEWETLYDRSDQCMLKKQHLAKCINCCYKTLSSTCNSQTCIRGELSK